MGGGGGRGQMQDFNVLLKKGFCVIVGENPALFCINSKRRTHSTCRKYHFCYLDYRCNNSHVHKVCIECEPIVVYCSLFCSNSCTHTVKMGTAYIERKLLHVSY